MAVATYISGSVLPLLTTELNSLANNQLKAGAAFTANNYLLAELELVVAFLSNPASGTGFSIWFLRALDGANYEDGWDASVTPAKPVSLAIGLRPVSTVQRETRGPIILPPGTWIPLVKNDGTAAATVATGNTLKIVASSFQQ